MTGKTISIPIIPFAIAGAIVLGVLAFYLSGAFDEQEVMVDVGSGPVTISKYLEMKETWRNNMDDMNCDKAQRYLDRSKAKNSLDELDMEYLTSKVKRCFGEA